MPSWSLTLLLAGAGFVSGVVNVIAGGGSFLTLPVLIFLGLPGTEANATNRVAILMQNVGAVWAFHRERVLDWHRAADTVVPALLGAALGTWAALHVGDREFRRILAFLMVALTVWTMLDPRARGVATGEPARLGRTGMRLAFLAVGVYGGFVQAGLGFLILAITTLAGMDLVRGNAVKVFAVLVLTALALAIFAGAGKVRWIPGLILGAGSVLGSLLGAHLTVSKGHQWVQSVVTATVVIFAVALWFD